LMIRVGGVCWCHGFFFFSWCQCLVMYFYDVCFILSVKKKKLLSHILLREN
jgi:hypothetical protein